MLTKKQISYLDTLGPYERYLYINKRNKRLNRLVFISNIFRFFTGKPRAFRYSLIDMIYQYDKKSPYRRYRERIEEVKFIRGWNPSLKDFI